VTGGLLNLLWKAKYVDDVAEEDMIAVKIFGQQCFVDRDDEKLQMEALHDQHVSSLLFAM